MTRVAIDITRLLHAPLSPTPRGIDRVEMAYAEHFLSESSNDNCAVAPTALGTRWFDCAQALHVLKTIDSVWSETADVDADPAYRTARHWLLTGDRGAHSAGRGSKARHFIGSASRILASFRSLGRPMRRLPVNSVYLNVGHYGLSFPGHLRWLRERRDIVPVFMLHDLIPLESSEYVSERESKAHRRRLALSTEFARALITNSETSRQQIVRYLGSEMKVQVLPLPVSPQFLKPIGPDDDLASVPYFVVCGAIEPRKNHLLLLDVWRRLIAEEGPIPRLLIVGTRQSGSTEFTKKWQAWLEDDRLLTPHVLEIEGLSTSGLCKLLAHARALLMSSFAEGFGLPIAEALALGTPVIASDIAAHREAGGIVPTYLPVSDGAAWMQAVRAQADHPARVARKGSAWRDYFGELEPFLQSLS